jgi:hypothetical protein
MEVEDGGRLLGGHRAKVQGTRERGIAGGGLKDMVAEELVNAVIHAWGRGSGAYDGRGRGGWKWFPWKALRRRNVSRRQ